MAKTKTTKTKTGKRKTGGGGYGAESIQILQNIDHVRARPGMYIGGVNKDGLHHIVWEILDNSVDEVINGHASKIEVVLEADHRGITIIDDGRGIPVDKHPELKMPAVVAVFTQLGAGGKFDGESYKHSGGLHGVGAAVANALAERLEVRVKRSGKIHEVVFDRGVLQGKMRKSGSARGTGTEVFLRPDPEIFGAKATLDPDVLRQRIEAKSYLHKGLKISFTDQATGKTETFHHAEGIAEYLDKLVAVRGKRAVHSGQFYLERNEEPRLELALAWTEATDTTINSYVNGVPTPDGGTHEKGLRSGLGKAIRAYVAAHKLEPKGVSIGLEDIREGLLALISVYVLEPQFQSQTKNRLNNPEVANQVESAVAPALEQWLHENRSVGDAIVARIILASRARAASRAAVSSVTRKAAGQARVNLPGKLADCASSDPRKSELFIVEGDSAGGSAKMGRDRNTQAILPLRGKVLNAAQASLAKVAKNEELGNIVKALGCGIGKDFDVSRLRYDRVILLMDADSDGHHIATLLLTFFYKYMPELIRTGHVYLAQPPLFRVDVGKETHWAADDAHLQRILAGIKRGKPEIQRFKGLGEMMPKTLRDTTLDPKKRQLIRVGIEDELATDRTIHDLMGKDASMRYQFIMERASEADELDI
ncbi:type IIA DNA topoisomerase subunit B [Pseudenhygromyxa sp. WMMC2535]|uniref:DNA gyrase/topoisomerase IV subunit B n=1 Tax=Pseudenhygromyxa sp. WMMC2535 TaxID=2712867 RepID=UPI00155264D1|nr:DNA topoisomerase IV subunit B [Pseudenhygromyxa sp. WMMC2535]NVB36208.1 type IIA DNA topoisomerase subunit B [Pseudenhygromyxa sp. WMMC2535]NVB43407.1 type IIA DNA topoisomerase subunit B [Pseudenhygromyxa sp. WMMC2535]